MHACVHVCMRVCVRACVHACMRVCVCVCVCVCGREVGDIAMIYPTNSMHILSVPILYTTLSYTFLNQLQLSRMLMENVF